jgi:3-deoxy-manno-octulosonate cytidylyltransferase (CMP-KDO synthetase)
MRSLAIIPARLNSTRLAEKALININGKSMIQRVYEQVKKCKDINDVIIATDDLKIYKHVESFKGHVMMTHNNHLSGTERCNEASQKLKKKYDIIINVQGDEPLINPKQITQIIKSFSQGSEKIVTLAKKITSKEAQNINTVKVNFNSDMIATSFYRSGNKDDSFRYKHIGIYGFRQNTLEKICSLATTENELKHKLEQLRWLDNNYKIKVVLTKQDSISIDTKEDLDNLLEHHSDKLT